MTTLIDIARAAQRIAHASPDFVYVGPKGADGEYLGCRYLTPDGEPSCLWGRAIVAAFGDDIKEQLADLEGGDIRYVLERLPLEDGGLDRYVEADLVRATGTCQARQDTRTPWGQAILTIDMWFDDHLEVTS